MYKNILFILELDIFFKYNIVECDNDADIGYCRFGKITHTNNRNFECLKRRLPFVNIIILCYRL